MLSMSLLPSTHMSTHEQVVAYADALLDRLHREYPEKLPFYCRDAAEELQTALDSIECIPCAMAITNARLDR